MPFKQGDILWGDSVTHPIVYWDRNNDPDSFIGVMLTRAARYGNIPLTAEHIKKVDCQGNPYNFKFNRTHIVDAKLIKKTGWGPYVKAGELTDKGIMEIDKYIANHPPTIWSDIASFKRRKPKAP